MTNEERAAWIRRGFVLFMAIAVVTGVWLFPKKAPKASTSGEAATSNHALEIILFHVPKEPECEQMSEILKKVEIKYNGQVLVTRVDINADPERAKAEKVTKPPKVVMMAGTIRASKFQGLWTQAQVERKVEEILRGLKRIGKDWRPDVQGMKPADAASPAAP